VWQGNVKRGSFSVQKLWQTDVRMAVNSPATNFKTHIFILSFVISTQLLQFLSFRTMVCTGSSSFRISVESVRFLHWKLYCENVRRTVTVCQGHTCICDKNVDLCLTDILRAYVKQTKRQSYVTAVLLTNRRINGRRAVIYLVCDSDADNSDIQTLDQPHFVA